MDFNWLWIVPVLGVLVIVHELGHFMTALWFKIRVEEFGIGFPPRAFGIRYKDIDYTINWLPIGGFVKIVGENGDSDDPRSFGRAAAWKRIIVLAAGSTMNLLLALFIFAGMAVAGTREVSAPRTGVSGFSPYLSTQEVNLAAGDRIASIAGVAVASSEEARAQSLQHSGQPTEFVIERKGGESETLTLTPKFQPAELSGMKAGDRIVSVAGVSVSTDDEIRAQSRAHAGTPTAFVVERDGQMVTLTITPNVNPVNGAYLGITLDTWLSPAVVGDIRNSGVADQAGLQPGDEIVSVNGQPVTNLPQASFLLSNSEAAPEVVVKRGDETLPPVTLQPGQNQSYGFGFERPYRTVYYNPVEAMGRALNNTWEVVSSVPRGLGQAFAGEAQGPGVTGPVGIGQLTGEVAQEGGINGLLQLTALLSISLFMINMLPLPALDGGRLLFIFIELLRGGRRIAPEKEGMVHFAGMMLLLAFLAIITFFDIQRLFEGQSILPR